MVYVASYGATSSRRELCKRRAFRLGGDTLCFELAQRPEHPRHQPRASLKAACEMNRLSLISMQAVASGPTKRRKTSNIDPSQQQQLLLAVSPSIRPKHTRVRCTHPQSLRYSRRPHICKCKAQQTVQKNVLARRRKHLAPS